MKETDCRKCWVDDFKNALCEEDFCEKYYREGNSEDFEKLLPRWISCSERLPEEYGEYLITWSSSGTSGRRFIEISEYEITGEYDHENNRFRGRWLLGDNFKEYEDVRVIAWMELPEAYREEE